MSEKNHSSLADSPQGEGPDVLDNLKAMANPASQATWSPEAEKKLIRKIDIRIFPTMIILFILNFIDRNNFANARLRGLEEDLKLTDVQYQTCLSILLVGYTLMQVPSNMILNKLTRPSWYLCTCVAIWGVISAATGAVHNFTGAVLCRFFLGVLEASFFPGSLLFLSRWYTRREMQLRVTILNAGNLAAQAFGGLIAAGILQDMQGAGGLAAWRWLFIIEGSLTVVFAGISSFILPDYPLTTSWLSDEEKHIAQTRLDIDNGLAAEGSTDDVSAKEGFFLAVRDPKVWLLGLTYFSTIMGLSFAFFFPTITQALHYPVMQTLLLTAPPWIWAVLISLPNAWHADRTGERFLHYFVPAFACIIGYIISATTSSVAPRYFSMFLMTTGFASGFVMLAWTSNTIAFPPAKRAAALGLVNAMGNVGSIPGTYIWRAEFGPLFVQPFGAMIAILGFACICALVLRFYLRYLNAKLDREEGTTSIEGGHVVDGVQGVRGFRYLY